MWWLMNNIYQIVWYFDTKITSQNSYLNEGWLFIGRLKVGSLPRMINKEVLEQFIYNPT